MFVNYAAHSTGLSTTQNPNFMKIVFISQIQLEKVGKMDILVLDQVAKLEKVQNFQVSIFSRPFWRNGISVPFQVQRIG